MAGTKVGGEEKSVLILGDWFVDEHWVCGPHRSSTSSRTGESFSRTLHPIGSEVRAFCGAGRSAYFLNQVKIGNAPLFDQLIGLGFWHENDTDALCSLFDRTNTLHSRHRLVDKNAGKPVKNVKLINLHEAMDTESSEQFTTQIIRIYQLGADDSVSYRRVDWEPPRTSRNWRPTHLTELARLIKGKNAKKPQKPSVIMIKDLRRGVVSDTLVDWLIHTQSGKDTRWYVSSKKWEPTWMSKLADANVDLRLFFVPDIAARDATGPGSELSAWIARSGGPTQEALQEIQDLHAKLGSREKTSIVVAPGGSRVICRSYGTDDAKCLVQPVEETERLAVPMGGASIFFPALCAYMEFQENQGAKPDMESALSRALDCTMDWVRAEANRVLNPDRWKPNPADWSPRPAFLDMATLGNGVGRIEMKSRDSWKDEVEWWKKATEPMGVGIVNRSGVEQIQLWRAMIEVNGYVCLEKEKRKMLRNLVRGIAEFKQNRDSHLACMLIASPGSGKTFLAKKLAEQVGLRFVPFNITQMSSRNDILDSFDTIVAMQQDEPDADLLIFVDEINANLSNDNVYGAFLSPLEEGVYVRAGKTFRIKPCVWMFAGTENPVVSKGNRAIPSKGEDFVSRLRLGVSTLDAAPLNARTEFTSQQLDLERVYLGISLLQSKFPDVKRVSKHVLEAFANLPDTATFRQVRNFISRFRDVQYSRVKLSNLPDEVPGGEPNERYKLWYQRAMKEPRPPQTPSSDEGVVRVDNHRFIEIVN